MRLIVISPESFIQNESQIVNKLFELGLECLHIRKPNADIESVRKFIRTIDFSFHPNLIVHCHLPLFEEFEIAGIHLKAQELNRHKEARGIISTSTHSIDELIALDRPGLQLFISPVFESISKTGYYSESDLLKAGSICRQGQFIALGGISDQNICRIKREGFDGAAVLGHLWQTRSPVANFIHLKQLIVD
ncbi:thiamine phosphate synthase [Olivibacter sp. XZL3]|uniref:thiamine phosphate synthase n=1 Tax=Olivibacter sp. XZL3 TaxID=1735116 RepID=UPI001066D365|nr:thiamine phosphate synthase [Olivibacter sp. XZL3]